MAKLSFVIQYCIDERLTSPQLPGEAPGAKAGDRRQDEDTPRCDSIGVGSTLQRAKRRERVFSSI